ncbi:hypothetical protein [Streptomyces sp. NPDC001759]
MRAWSDGITLPRAGRTRVWFATQYGIDVVSEWPELREWRPPRLTPDRTAARLRVGHALTVTETGLAFASPGCCSSWTAPALPASRRGYAPCTPPSPKSQACVAC